MFPIIKSALRPDAANLFAKSSPKNSITVSIPFSIETFAVASVGSIPRQGILESLKYLSRYPSLDAISMTLLDLSKSRNVMILST